MRAIPRQTRFRRSRVFRCRAKARRRLSAAALAHALAALRDRASSAFRPKLLDTLPGYRRAEFGRNLAAGVTVGGPAGAFIVIVYGIVERYGVADLIIASAMSGVMLFLLGLFRLGVLVRSGLACTARANRDHRAPPMEARYQH